MEEKVDLVFAKEPDQLLINVKSHLEKENLSPVSLNIVKECNNFCAIVVGKQKEEMFE